MDNKITVLGNPAKPGTAQPKPIFIFAKENETAPQPRDRGEHRGDPGRGQPQEPKFTLQEPTQPQEPDCCVVETYGVNSRIEAEGSREYCQSEFIRLSTEEAQRWETSNPKPQFRKSYRIYEPAGEKDK